jgi:nicotinamidase/pyrazinamidase
VSERIQQVFLKGTGNRDDGYSAYEATNLDLKQFLKEQGVTEIYVTGLATDYCVRASALDSVKNGFKTYVVTDAVAAVNLQPDDGTKALEELRSAGVTLVPSTNLS